MTQKKLERIIYIIVGIMVVVRLIAAYYDQNRMHYASYEATPAPNFTWRDFNSDKHQLSDLKGKVVILHFWATWCGPCRTEFPELLIAAEKLKDDAVFLTISGDEDDAPVRKFLAAAKAQAHVAPDNVLYGFDPMKVLTFDVFQTSAFPETIILDPQHNLRRKYPGTQNWRDPKVLDYIRDLKNLPAAKIPGAKPASDAPSSSGQVPTP